MKALKLKEKDSDVFLIFEGLSAQESNAVVTIEQDGERKAIELTGRQLSRIQEWVQAKKDLFYKENGVRFDTRIKR